MHKLSQRIKVPEKICVILMLSLDISHKRVKERLGLTVQELIVI